MSNPSFIPTFVDAERIKLKASIMIEGLTGKGKSGLALAIAHVLANKDWSKIAVIDTENQSSNLFVGIDSSNGETFGKFKVFQLTPDIGFRPTNYIYAREMACKELGAEVVIEDSISHAWMYQGGVLDLVNTAKSNNPRFAKDSYAAWSDETVAKEKNELLRLLRDPNCHVISTVRVKEKFEYTTDDKGKNTLTSLGEQQIQQADLKYEPDLVLHMLRPGRRRGEKVTYPKAKVIKSRYQIFDEGEEYEFTPELIAQLKEYLESGADPNKILEQQRQEYIEAVKNYLQSFKGTAKHDQVMAIWKELKKMAGHESTKLEDIPLEDIRKLFVNITS